MHFIIRGRMNLRTGEKEEIDYERVSDESVNEDKEGDEDE